MDDKRIFEILRPLIMTVSGVPECILANQNNNSPKEAYASVQVRTNVSERGQANIYRKNEFNNQVEGDVRAQQVVTCVVEFYRGEANAMAASLQQMGKRSDVSWVLFKEKMSIRNVGTAIDLTALQSSNYEKRARIELYLWLESSSKYVVNNILGTSIAVENEEGDVLQTIAVDI